VEQRPLATSPQRLGKTRLWGAHTTAVLRPSALCFLQEQQRRLASACSTAATPATTIAVLRTSIGGRLQRAATGSRVLGCLQGGLDHIRLCWLILCEMISFYGIN